MNIYKDYFNNGKVYNGQKILCSNCNVPSTYTEYLTSPGGYLQFEVCDTCQFEQKAGRGNTIDTYNRCVYEEKCKCGNKVMVTTQPDNYPEYTSEVGVVCSKCGKLVMFSLPAN